MSYETDDKLVSHPDHYRSGKYEVIDIIDEFTKDLKGTEAVCTANAIKYILRWKKKNGIQDIKKAIWYLQHLVDKEDERLEEQQHAEFNEWLKTKEQKKEPKHSCMDCAYAYRHDDVLCCGHNSGLPCNDELLNGGATCSFWESKEDCQALQEELENQPDGESIDKEESDLSVETHTNAAGVTVPDSEPWREEHLTVFMTCHNCRYKLRKHDLEPCKSCKLKCNWKPKENETNEQSSET